MKHEHEHDHEDEDDNGASTMALGAALVGAWR